MQQPGSPSRTIGWMGLSLVSALPGEREGGGVWLTKKKEGRGRWKRGLWCRSEQINGPEEFLVVCTGERDYLPSYPLCVRACVHPVPEGRA